jgi:hypothetical protein
MLNPLIVKIVVFISFSLFRFSAQDIAHSRSHKTIAATDVLKALELIEMDDMVPELQAALQGLFQSEFYFPFRTDRLAPNSIQNEPNKGRKCQRERKGKEVTAGANVSISRPSRIKLNHIRRVPISARRYFSKLPSI